MVALKMMRNPTLNINTLCCAIVTRQIRKSLDGYFLSTPFDNASGLDGGDDDDDDDQDY